MDSLDLVNWLMSFLMMRCETLVATFCLNGQRQL